MVNCNDKNKKVDINFNSWRKFPLDNRQPSKALKFNRQLSKSAKLNRQPSKSDTPIETLMYHNMSDGSNNGHPLVFVYKYPQSACMPTVYLTFNLTFDLFHSASA